MRNIEKVVSAIQPEDILTGPTGTRLRYGAIRVTESVTGSVMWQYGEWWLPDGEYLDLCHGMLPGDAVWTADLHKFFRQYQHSRTDDLYAMAQREIRTAADPSKWQTYLTALDEWNAAVSALAETLSTAVPDLPSEP